MSPKLGGAANEARANKPAEGLVTSGPRPKSHRSVSWAWTDRVNSTLMSAQTEMETMSEQNYTVYVERTIIEQTLEAGRCAAALEARHEHNPAGAQYFNKFYAELAHLFEEVVEPGISKEYRLVIPDFRASPHHSDPNIAARIDLSFQKLKYQRSQFLAGIKQTLAEDRRLRMAFARALRERVGSQLALNVMGEIGLE